MTLRDYYSVRTNKALSSQKISLELLKRLFRNLYEKYEKEGYFQKHFGYDCVDIGHVPGSLGRDVAARVFLQTRNDDLWPLETHIEKYEESDLFTMIEFLHDHIAKPIEGYMHQFANCGMHYTDFDDNEGRKEYIKEVNHLLKDYEKGYELSNDGEILILDDLGHDTLLEAPLPTEESSIKSRVESAKLKFRSQKSNMDDRRNAVRDLADVLEYLRPQAKLYLKKDDESDLFNIANNFGIRHHNSKQKINYDENIWFSWMFYYYLCTIHALVRITNKADS